VKCDTCGAQTNLPCSICASRANRQVLTGVLLLATGIVLVVVILLRYEVIGTGTGSAVKMDRVTGESTVIEGRTEYPVAKGPQSESDSAQPIPGVSTSPSPRIPGYAPPLSPSKPAAKSTDLKKDPIAELTLDPDSVTVSNFGWRLIPGLGMGDQDDYNAKVAKKTHWVEFSIRNNTRALLTGVVVRLKFKNTNYEVVHSIEGSAVYSKDHYEPVPLGQIPKTIPPGQTKAVKIAVFAPSSAKNATVEVLKVIKADE